MGRKGMKGFMKSATRPSDKPADDEAAEEQQAAAPPSAAAGSKGSSSSSSSQPRAAEPESTPKAAASDSEDEGQGGKESRSKMLQRHKREMLAHKKAVQRMGKKSKDELAKLDAEIEARHAQELQQLDAAAAAPAAAAGGAAAQQAAVASDGSTAAADKASKYLMDLSIGEEQEEDGEQKGKKTTKAQKRREKQAAKQAERDARIAAELEAAGPSERDTEEAALKALLAPLGLGIKEIRADGHCLYRSLEDQLETTAAAAADAKDDEAAGLLNYQELRELAAEHIRQHKDQFAPFLLPEDESEDPEQHYEKYCFTLETTAAWGGHLELTALAAALQRQIKVHAVGMPTVTIGDEFAGESKAPALELCYLRHAFGLGEHYNSTKKARFVRFFIEGEDGEQGAGGAGEKEQQQQQQQGGEEDGTEDEAQE